MKYWNISGQRSGPKYPIKVSYGASKKTDAEVECYIYDINSNTYRKSVVLYLRINASNVRSDWPNYELQAISFLNLRKKIWEKSEREKIVCVILHILYVYGPSLNLKKNWCTLHSLLLYDFTWDKNTINNEINFYLIFTYFTILNIFCILHAQYEWYPPPPPLPPP